MEKPPLEYESATAFTDLSRLRDRQELRRSQVKRAIVAVLLSVLLVVLVGVGGIGYFFYQIHKGTSDLDAVALLPAHYQPAALDLVKLCQSDPAFFTQEMMSAFDPAWAPSSIGKLHPEDIQISADRASVTWGGGFYHCGWELVRQPDADSGPNHTWTLSFTREMTPVRVLMTFPAPADLHFTTEELVLQTIKELKWRSGTDRFNNMVAQRLSLMLKYGLVKAARDSVGECAGKYPDDWRDQLLLYLIDRQKDPQAAASALREWARGQEGFDRWIVAAHGFAQAGEIDQMQSAVNLALTKPIHDDPTAPANARHLGLPICEKLYEAGCYSSCVALCDALAAYDNGPGAGASYLQPEISRMRAAAAAAVKSGEKVPPPVQFPNNEMFEPFDGIDLDRLLQVPATTQSNQR